MELEEVSRAAGRVRVCTQRDSVSLVVHLIFLRVRTLNRAVPNFSNLQTAVAVERRRGGLLVVWMRPETSFDPQGLFIR